MTPVSVQAAAASVLQVSEPTFLAYSRMLSNKPQDGRGLVDQANGYFPQAADVISQNDTHYTALHTPSCTYPFPPVPLSGLSQCFYRYLYLKSITIHSKSDRAYHKRHYVHSVNLHPWMENADFVLQIRKKENLKISVE